MLTESRPNTLFALCEAWLDNSIYDSQLIDLARFKVYRQDRNRFKGGVLVAILSSITCTGRHNLDWDNLEAIFVDLHAKQRLLHPCVAPPLSKTTESYDLLPLSLSSITLSKLKYSSVLAVGNFNAHIDWSDASAFVPTGPSDAVLLTTWKHSDLPKCAANEATAPAVIKLLSVTSCSSVILHSAQIVSWNRASQALATKH